MSKARKRLDVNAKRQLNLFDYDAKIEEYVQLKTEILKDKTPAPRQAHSWEEACVELAAACKAAVKQSGLSRDQVVDRINEYFGWEKNRDQKSADRDQKTKGELSIHMFNHYMSKPSEYPLPSYLIFAIQSVTGSLIPCKCLASAENAKVISNDEVKHYTIGKIDDNILELQKLKKELRGR